MANNDGTLRVKQGIAWIVLGVFVAGFFVGQIGAWTGPILNAWFVGTQRLRRGFLWMLAFSVLFGLPHLGIGIAHAGAAGALSLVGSTLAAMLIGILPFTFYRMVGTELPGFVATLALPFGGVLLGSVDVARLLPGVGGNAHIAHAATFGSLASIFLIYWTAAVLMWAWNQEFRITRIAAGASAFAVAAGALLGLKIVLSPAQTASLAEPFFWMCLAGAIVLAIWNLILERRRQGWDCAPETLRVLRSPATGAALKLVHDGGGELLESATGERFPIHNHIADMRFPGDLTGDNQKYNRLYETIGGFYDDIQRVVCACSAMDGDAYVRSYMGPLEVKAGDSVLETSVGTGLNFKYLPAGVSLTGIDLSPEMLINCRAKLRRLGLQGNLFLGNAECLPFADESFDVVFHVGGINFFNDRAKAIREMIRVAKPGSKILIADETEEHVKDMYERGPITSGFYKNRREPVTAPVDLVPPEMLETHLELLKPMGKNRFYALTFRKPAQCDVAPVLTGCGAPGRAS